MTGALLLTLLLFGRGTGSTGEDLRELVPLDRVELASGRSHEGRALQEF